MHQTKQKRQNLSPRTQYINYVIDVLSGDPRNEQISQTTNEDHHHSLEAEYFRGQAPGTDTVKRQNIGAQTRKLIHA